MASCFDSTASATLRGNGSVTINAAPPPGWFRTSTCPPCCTMIFCTTASPSPVPFAFVVKKGTKSFRRNPRSVIRNGDPLEIRLIAAHDLAPNDHAPSIHRRRARFRGVSPHIQQCLPQQTFIAAHFSEGSLAPNLYLRNCLSHFRNHALHHLLQCHHLIRDFQRARVLQKLGHHVRDVPCLFQDSLRVVRSLLLGWLRLDHLRVPRNDRQRVLEFVCDSRRQLSESRQVFFQLHSLLQRRQLRQIRQQADGSANIACPSPDRRNGHPQVPFIPCGRNMLDFFAPVNSPCRQALRNQLHQLRGCPQRFAVPPESQPANSQHLLRRRIRAGNKSRGIHH